MEVICHARCKVLEIKKKILVNQHRHGKENENILSKVYKIPLRAFQVLALSML